VSRIPPIPNGFSSLCSGPAVKPSSDIIMFSFSSLTGSGYYLSGCLTESPVV
jgi:hypothetical protein